MKFKTAIQEDGVIRIPELARLARQNVEAFVVLDSDVALREDRALGMQEFLDKGQGFLKGYDADELSVP